MIHVSVVELPFLCAGLKWKPLSTALMGTPFVHSFAAAPAFQGLVCLVTGSHVKYLDPARQQRLECGIGSGSPNATTDTTCPGVICPFKLLNRPRPCKKESSTFTIFSRLLLIVSIAESIVVVSIVLFQLSRPSATKLSLSGLIFAYSGVGTGVMRYLG
jgi:hypothetical protein